MIDFEPATGLMGSVLDGIDDVQMTAPTPCPDYTVGDLVQHVTGLVVAFRLAAEKQRPPGGSTAPSGDASRLPPDWRPATAANLVELAAAWREPDAWAGMTSVGGVDLPGEVAAIVGLDELVVHAWDLSRATGQPFAVADDLAEACLGFVSQAPPGPFGPPVPVADDAPAIDRLIGAAGRDPDWRA